MTGNKKRRPIGKRETEEVAATERKKKEQHKSTYPRYAEVRCCAGLKMMEVTDDGDDDDDDDDNDFDCDGKYFEDDDDDDDDEEGSHST